MIALSDVGIPFRDPKLNESSDEVHERRANEREVCKGCYKNLHQL